MWITYVLCFVCVQPVNHTDSSVTPVNAFIKHTDVTDAVTAVTAAMNATVVSSKVTCVLLKLWWNYDRFSSDVRPWPFPGDIRIGPPLSSSLTVRPYITFLCSFTVAYGFSSISMSWITGPIPQLSTITLNSFDVDVASFIVISMTKSPLFVLLSPVLNHRPLLPFLSAVFSGSSRRSHQTTSRWSCGRCLTNSVRQIHWLLKKNADLAPFLCQLFNWSLEHGVVPSSFKSAYITPLLKKADLDAADVKSYRPISNLSVVSSCLKGLLRSSLWVTSKRTICYLIFSLHTEHFTRRTPPCSRYCLTYCWHSIPARQRSFGSLRAVGSFKFHRFLSAWGRPLLPRPPLFVTLVSTSTRVSAWPHTFPRQCRVVFLRWG